MPRLGDRRDFRDRLDDLTQKQGEHLIWTGYHSHPNRPGILKDDNRRNRSARSVIWEHFRGPIPEGMMVLRTCEVGLCVEVNHMTLGGHAEMQDIMDIHDKTPRGDRHPMKRPEVKERVMAAALPAIERARAERGNWGKPPGRSGNAMKLTYDQADALRAEAAAGANRTKLACQYGISTGYLQSILSGRAMVRPKSAEERFRDCIVEHEGHWLWAMAADHLTIEGVTMVPTHWSYRLFVGPLPDWEKERIQILPTCGEASCVRPDHLALVGSLDWATRRFWEKVNKTDDCWLWTGHAHPKDGHGMFSYLDDSGETRGTTAHRFSWFLAHGSWPDGHVFRSCTRARCVRPDHLTMETPRGEQRFTI